MGDEKATAPGATGEPKAGGFDVRLVGLCVLLWVVAGGILLQNWPDTKRDYYWGNIMQALEGQPPRLDNESITALAAMGDGIIPSCSYELSHHWNPAFKCAVLKVLEQTDGKGALEIIEGAVTRDLDARVRANGLMSLRARAKRVPSEAAAVARVAAEVALGKTNPDPNPDVRTAAALVLGEAGDGRAEVKALLVHGLRTPNPFFRKDIAVALAKINEGGPKFDADAKGKDLIDGIIAYEDWCEKNNIALIESRLTIAPVGSAGVGPVTTRTGDGK